VTKRKRVELPNGNRFFFEDATQQAIESTRAFAFE
jgi:hypothetical protein